MAKKAKAIRPPDHKDLLQELRHEDGYRVVEFAGKRYHWFFCGLGIRRAKSEGYRPLRILSELATMGLRGAAAQRSENGEMRRYLASIDEDEILIHYGVLFFTGTAVFYDHSLESILARMTVRRMHEVQSIIVDEIKAMAEASVLDEDEPEAEPAGNLPTTP